MVKKRPEAEAKGKPDKHWARARHEAKKAGKPSGGRVLEARAEQLRSFSTPSSPAQKKPTAAQQRDFFSAVQRKYGLSRESYLHMLVAQNSACKICRGELVLFSQERKQHPVVDHCHKTGKVRALLCHGCNVRVGRVEFVAEAELYLAAKRYVEGT